MTMHPNFRRSMTLIVIVISAGFAAGSVQASEGHEGPHGGSAVFVAGVPYPADIFIHSSSDNLPVALSDEMLDYLKAVRDIWQVYGVESKSFWDKIVLGPEVDFRFVTTLPCSDDPLPLPDRTLQQISVACTREGVTYLLRGIFDLFDFQSKALMILHERLHAFAPLAPHTAIAELVNATHVLISQHEKQVAGSRRRLLPDEYRALTEMPGVAKLLGFDDHTADRRQIYPRGGGVVIVSSGLNLQVSDDNFIGVGSEVSYERDCVYVEGTVFSTTTVIDSIIRCSVVRNSWIRQSSIDSRGSLIDSSRIGYSRLESSSMRGARSVDSWLRLADFSNSVEVLRSHFLNVKATGPIRLQDYPEDPHTDPFAQPIVYGPQCPVTSGGTTSRAVGPRCEAVDSLPLLIPSPVKDDSVTKTGFN